MNNICKGICLIISTLLLSASVYGYMDPYLKERNALLNGETRLRFSSNEVLNKKEIYVDKELQILQRKEKGIRTSKESIQNIIGENHASFDTPLMSFMKRMPKGGVLHIHSTALADLHWIVSKAASEPNCYIYLGKDEGKWVRGSFHMFQNPPSKDWKKLVDLKKKSEKKEVFDQRLYRLVTLGLQDLAQGVDVWERFENCFKRVKGIVRYTPFRKEFLKRGFLEYAKQNVQYLEIRSSLSKLYDLTDRSYSDEDYVSLYQDAVLEVQELYPDFSVKIIHAAHRTAEPSEMSVFLQRFTKIRSLYPQMMVGFDIVKQEDGSHSQYYYLSELLKFKHENEDLVYFFHAGETNERENDNLLDSILLGTRRIGHGLTMANHPKLMQLAREREIAVEVCPISNQVLGFVGDMRNHPARTLMNFGVPIVLSPDDPGMMNYPFSYDFFEACVYWDLDLKDLKTLSRNSLIYSGMGKQEKEQALKSWEKKWDQFISWACQENLGRRV